MRVPIPAKATAALLSLIWLPGPARSGETQARVAAEPVLARIEQAGQTRIVMRGRLGKKRARQMELLARAVQKDVARRFLTARDKSGLPPVDMCLFASTRAYRSFVDEAFWKGYDVSDWGFYVPGRRLVVANVGASRGNLRHELTHALLGDDFPDIPDWLNEGLGSLYGSAVQTRKGFRFLVNYRLRHLRKALADRQLPSLEDLARSGRRDVYGPRSLAYYALSRYVLLYLDGRGKLDAFVRELRAGPLTAGRQLAVLKKYVDYEAFIAWTRKLRFEPRRKP
ncbi:MAG: hypothetical protein JXR96_09685 [Deltaproteobacteria bacterium]|nr:hypothetical protein [Deltaproteobacteria bacterium]